MAGIFLIAISNFQNNKAKLVDLSNAMSLTNYLTELTIRIYSSHLGFPNFSINFRV